MSGRNAKLIRRAARDLNIPEKELKRCWYRANVKQKQHLRLNHS